MSCLAAKDTGEYYLSCCDCICDIDHKKELEGLIEMWDKEFEEFETFEGLKIPNGIERVQRCDYGDEACALGCTSCADYEKAGCVGSGITKIDCTDCLCSEDNEEFLEKYLQQQADNSLIKPGMVVKSESGNYYLVFSVEEDCINGWAVMDTTSEVGKLICELRAYVRVPLSCISEVYKIGSGRTMPDGDDVLMLVGNCRGRDKYWEEIDPPVLELTVEDTRISTAERSRL